MSRGRFKTADSSVRVAFVVRFHVLLCDRSTEMVVKYKDQEIASLADIQRLTAKDLRIIVSVFKHGSFAIAASLDNIISPFNVLVILYRQTK